MPLTLLHGDPSVARWMGSGQPLSWTQCAAWVQVSQANQARRGYAYSAVIERVSGEFIGGAGLVHPTRRGAGGTVTEPPGPVELIYALSPSRWGRGLASEMVGALLNWGAARHGLDEVIATVMPDNLASQAVLRRAGFEWLFTQPDADEDLVATWRWRAPALASSQADRT